MAADSGSAAPTPPAASSGSAEWGTDCEQRPIFKAHDGALADGRQHTVAAGAQGVITYFFKAPWTGDVQLLKSRAVLDNRKVVHHWAMWAVDSTAAKDGEVRGAMGETVEALGGEQFVAGGGPGATDVELPPNVGMRMATGSNLLIELEIHYYNAGEADEADASSVELCLTSKKRPVEAAVHSLGRASFELPAHTKTDVVSTCRPTELTDPVHIVAVTPHMHLTGVHATVVLNRQSGEKVTLVDKPYMFQEQRSYLMPEDRSAPDVIVNPGDTITSTCSYNNTTDAAIYEGEKSQDEMCLMGVLAWPAGGLRNAIGALLGVVPSTGSLGDVICLEP